MGRLAWSRDPSLRSVASIRRFDPSLSSVAFIAAFIVAFIGRSLALIPSS